MTLIAAVRHLGVPVLFADSLVTGGSSEMTTQKIHRIRSDFVVAFTGAWKNDEPSQFRLGDQLARGSGTERYVRVIGQGFLGSKASEQLRFTADVALLREMSHLMEDEVGLRSNRTARFGHSYEAVFLSSSGSFEFLGDALFAFVDAFFDDSGKCVSRDLFPEMFVLRRVNGISVTEKYVYAENGPSKEYVNFTNFPAMIPDSDVDATIQKVFRWTVSERLAVRHVCLNVALVARHLDGVKVIAKVPLVSTNFDRAKAHHYGVWAEVRSSSDQGHTLVARLPPVEVLEAMFRTISADIGKSPPA